MEKGNGRPVETDAADGNPHTSRIPTAAWKAKTAFHEFPQAQQQSFPSNERVDPCQEGAKLLET